MKVLYSNCEDCFCREICVIEDQKEEYVRKLEDINMHATYITIVARCKYFREKE